MPIDSTRPFPRQLLAAALRLEDERPDRELLARFAATRDEDSFAELVRRHGRLVLAVTRRVTACQEDAEDAFQAAFLVLARRAGQIARPELLANWLYGVAYRTALEARNSRRRIQEQPLVSAAVPEPPDYRTSASPEDAELRRVIDEELAALPEKFRSCVVLCDLEGVSRKDAAEKLNIPEGTLSSRLNHARKVLAVRLTRRGITASGGALGTFLTREAVGAVIPPALTHQTIRAAARFASGGMLLPDIASPKVASLTDGVLKAMLLTRARLLIGAVSFGVLGIGAAVGLGQFPEQAQNGQPEFNPFVVHAPAPKDAPLPPEKVPAKGIEDDEVPYPSSLIQAVVRMEENGKLMIRQRTKAVIAVKKEINGKQQITAYERQAAVVGRAVDASDLSVFDMKGNRLTEKAWKEKLKGDKLVLVSLDGRIPPPRDLQLVKDDTLLFVFPPNAIGHDAFMTPGTLVPAATLYRLRQGSNGLYYEPEAALPAYPSTPAPAAVPPASTLPARP